MGKQTWDKKDTWDLVSFTKGQYSKKLLFLLLWISRFLVVIRLSCEALSGKDETYIQ